METQAVEKEDITQTAYGFLMVSADKLALTGLAVKACNDYMNAVQIGLSSGIPLPQLDDACMKARKILGMIPEASDAFMVLNDRLLLAAEHLQFLATEDVKAGKPFYSVKAHEILGRGTLGRLKLGSRGAYIFYRYPEGSFEDPTPAKP